MQWHAWGRGYERIELYLPQEQLYLESVHHNIDTKFSCCTEYVVISCMEVGKKNINKSTDWIYMLSDNKFVTDWSASFLYRALCGHFSAGDGEYVWNRAWISCVCVCVCLCVCLFVCVFLLVLWEGKWGLVIRSLTNGTECESQNRIVMHWTENVSH
jgi:hypothetical protein